MKAVAVFLVIFLALSVDASHNRKHKAKNVRHEETTMAEYDEGDEEWPQPEVVRNFGVPQEFTASPPPDGIIELLSNPSSGKHHHGKQHQKSHSH